MKKLFTFVSILFAVALIAKTIVFVTELSGGGMTAGDFWDNAIELSIAWVAVLVGSVVYVNQLVRGFGRPKVIPFPLPFPVREDAGDTECDGKPDEDGTEESTGADGKPEGDGSEDGEQ